MSRSSGRRLANYRPKDPYRGRCYEDDPRALPPMPLMRLTIETASGCGSSAAMCAEATAQPRKLYPSDVPWTGRATSGGGQVPRRHVSA